MHIYFVCSLYGIKNVVVHIGGHMQTNTDHQNDEKVEYLQSAVQVYSQKCPKMSGAIMELRKCALIIFPIPGLSFLC